MDRHLRAQSEYVGRPFAGPILLFMSEEFYRAGQSERWKSLAQGGSQAVVLPNTTHRSMSLLRERGLAESVAGQLQAHLDGWNTPIEGADSL